MIKSEKETEEGEVNYLLSPTDYIDKAFKRIPNGIIDKGRCGIGGTTLELRDDRHSIIVVPNISIIKNKQKQFPNILEVYGETSEAKIVEYFQININKKIKIMSTPESCYKIAEASQAIGFNIYENCFLLADEAHAVITEGSYRSIWTFYDFFFRFKNRATISATPLVFSDIRFNSMKKHIIRFTKSSSIELNLILTKSVERSFKTLVDSKKTDVHNLHIFYNTVEGIAQMIDLIGSENVSVFCADSLRNRETLGKYENLLGDVNSDEYFVNKVNFYTTKYFEGWDLRDDKAEIILISDTYRVNTCFGINTKGIQAIGRLRNSLPKAIYHITNTKEQDEVRMRKFEDIRKIKIKTAEDIIRGYNYFTQILDNLNLTEEANKMFYSAMSTQLTSFGDISSTDGRGKINYFKVDTAINNDVALEQFLNNKTIIDSWEANGFTVKARQDYVPLTRTEKNIINSKRISRIEKNRVVYEKFKLLTPIQGKSSNIIFFGNEELDNLIEQFPEEYKIFSSLGFDKIESLHFRSKALKEEYIVKNSNKIEMSIDLLNLLSQQFRTFTFYPSDDIKRGLMHIYEKLGEKKCLPASNISKFFDAEQQVKKVNGKAVRGFFIRTPLFKYNFA